MVAVDRTANQATIASRPWGTVNSILGGSFSNLVEWYDWYAYSSFALYFSQAFFPKGDRTAQLLNAAAVFAIGFLARPLGSWLMGIYADRAGRRSGMLLSTSLMGVGSLGVALIPAYASIGVYASLFLVVARVFQGLSVGGQYGSSSTYLSEVSEKSRRGFIVSFYFVTQLIGLFFVMSTLLVLQALLPNSALVSWGWRVPFLLGAVLAGIGLIVIGRLEETKPFEAVKSRVDQVKPWKALLQYRKEVIIVFLITMAGTVAFQNYATYMPKFLVNTSGFSPDAAAQISTAALISYTILHPIAGWLSDIFGRRALLVWWTALATIYTYPAMVALSHTKSEILACLILSLAMAPLSLYTSISALFKAEMFPAEIRAFGLGLPYAISVAIFGGTAEVIALSLKQAGHEPLYFWYMTATMAVALVASLAMRDPMKYSKIED